MEALILVDYQYDFVDPNGSLYVNGAEKLKDYILEKIHEFKKENKLVIATKDWHPKDHYSFAKWPVHCIKNTKGAEMYIDENLFDFIILKGTEKNAESYSGFFDENGKSNGLNEILTKNNIKKIIIFGVATDVCVSATANDAIKLNYETIVDLNGCVGITNNVILK